MNTRRERAQLAADTAKKIRDYTLAALMSGLTAQTIEDHRLLAAAADMLQEVAPPLDSTAAYNDFYDHNRYITGDTASEILDKLLKLPGATVIQDANNIVWQAHTYARPETQRWQNTQNDPPADDWELRHLSPFRVLYTPEHDPSVETGYRRVT